MEIISKLYLLLYLIKKYADYLKQHGIVVKSLNLKNPLQSDRYNPFLYIQNYSDLIGLITNIQNSVTPPDAQKGDPFWQGATRSLLKRQRTGNEFTHCPEN